MKTAVLAHNGDYVWADGAFNEHIVILRVQRSAALCEKKSGTAKQVVMVGSMYEVINATRGRQTSRLNINKSLCSAVSAVRQRN